MIGLLDTHNQAHPAEHVDELHRAVPLRRASLRHTEVCFNEETEHATDSLANAARALSQANVTDIHLVKLLGSGGFGAVYKGFLGDLPVAVKRLHTRTKNELAKMESYRAELNLLRLTHPNVVAAFCAAPPPDDGEDHCDGGDENGSAILVMEFVGDRNLLHVIDDPCESLDLDRRLKYASNLSEALAYIHSRCVVHLDVKPSNVLISKDDSCKLGDFGCCQVVEEDTGEVTPTKRSHLTGTFAYRAPELLKGEPPSTKADVYAFGITLWQMLTRVTPYAGENQHVVIFGVVAYNLRPTLSPTAALFGADLEEELGDDLISERQDLRDCLVEQLYRELFVQCWDADAGCRPSAEVLAEVLDLWTSS